MNSAYSLTCKSQQESYAAMSLGLRFCVSRKGWDRERWVGAPEGCKQHGHVWARP